MENGNLLDIELENGKYRVILPKDHEMYALRRGEKWRDLCGDNLIYYLAVEVQELREKIESAKNCLFNTDNSASQNLVDTLKILEDKNV
jgi:hypothetical protein